MTTSLELSTATKESRQSLVVYCLGLMPLCCCDCIQPHYQNICEVRFEEESRSLFLRRIWLYLRYVCFLDACKFCFYKAETSGSFVKNITRNVVLPSHSPVLIVVDASLIQEEKLGLLFRSIKSNMLDFRVSFKMNGLLHNYVRDIVFIDQGWWEKQFGYMSAVSGQPFFIERSHFKFLFFSWRSPRWMHLDLQSCAFKWLMAIFVVVVYVLSQIMFDCPFKTFNVISMILLMAGCPCVNAFDDSYDLASHYYACWNSAPP